MTVTGYERCKTEELTDIAYNWDDETSVCKILDMAYDLGRGVWTAIADKTPETEGRYLVYCDGIGGSPGYIEVMHWFSPLQDFFSRSATHWMLLPPPPAGSP